MTDEFQETIFELVGYATKYKDAVETLKLANIDVQHPRIKHRMNYLGNYRQKPFFKAVVNALEKAPDVATINKLNDLTGCLSGALTDPKVVDRLYQLTHPTECKVLDFFNYIIEIQ